MLTAVAVPLELNLNSVYAKLNWAISHFELIDTEILAWLHSGNNEILYQRNEDATQHYLRAWMPGPRPDFERWSLMIGDCLTNLRDCLDHAVYAIAQLPTSPRPDKRDKACFLMTTNHDDFVNWGKTKLASVPTAVRDVMLNFQPYNRTHPILPPLLSLLSDLANGNKHRLLNVAITSPGIAEIEFVSKAAIAQPGKVGIVEGDVEHNAVFFVFEVETPDPSIYLKSAKLSLNVAIKHRPRIGDTDFGSDRTSYGALIRELIGEVAMTLDAMVAVL